MIATSESNSYYVTRYIVIVRLVNLGARDVRNDPATTSPRCRRSNTKRCTRRWRTPTCARSSRKTPPEDDDSANYPKAFIEVCSKVVEESGGMDTVLDRVAGITIETVSG
jgi:hypothetical protein